MNEAERNALVADAAEAQERFGDDELERYAAQIRAEDRAAAGLEPEAEPEATPSPEMAAAIATLTASMADPIRMAAENAELRDSLKGAYVLLRAVLKAHVGVNATFMVPRSDWMAPDPNERLQVGRDVDGNATLTLVRKNRAERRLTRAKA